MAVELGVGYVSIVPETKGLGKALSKDMNAASKSVGKAGGKSLGSELASSANSAFSSAFGAAAIGASVVAAVAGSIRAFAESEQVQIKLERAVANTGASYERYGGQIESLIAKSSQLAAVDDEEVSEAFGRLVQSTGDVSKAQKYLGTTLDLARARGMKASAAADVIGKVYNGNIGILKRYSINVEEGATSTEALGEIQRKYAGYAEDYGNSTAGAADKIAIAFGNMQEALGEVAINNLGLEVSLTHLTMVMNHAANGEWKEFLFLTDEEAAALDALANQSDATADAVKSGAASTGDAAYEAAGATSSYDDLTRAMNGTMVAADSLEGQERTHKELKLSMKEANLDLKQAEDAVAGALKEHGRKSDEYKQAVYRRERAELRAADAVADLRAAEEEAAGDRTYERGVGRKRSELQKLVAKLERAISLTRTLAQTSWATNAIPTGGFRMASGSIFPATSGGVPVTVAEAGYAEAVIPLNRQPRSLALLAQAARTMLGDVGSAMTQSVIVNAPIYATVSNDYDVERIAEILERRATNSRRVKGAR